MTPKRIAIVLAPRASAFADSDSPERDTAALSLALDLAKQSGASTQALTVAGPLQSAQVCQEAIGLGCQQALCVRSPVQVDFLGAATLLAQVLRDTAPDLIICGDHFADHGNAAIAGALARLLDRPLLTGVLAAEFNDEGLWVRTRTDFGQQEQQCRGSVILAALQTHERSGACKPVSAKTKAKSSAKVEDVSADSLLDDTSVLRAHSEMVGYKDFSASAVGVELISEPAELLSRLLKEKLWKP